MTPHLLPGGGLRFEYIRLPFGEVDVLHRDEIWQGALQSTPVGLHDLIEQSIQTRCIDDGRRCAQQQDVIRGGELQKRKPGPCVLLEICRAFPQSTEGAPNLLWPVVSAVFDLKELKVGLHPFVDHLQR